jgi:RND family efflux transporter MFP subunit
MQSKAFKVLLPVVLVLAALAVTVVMVKTRPRAQRQTPPAPQPRVTVFQIEGGHAPVHVKGFGSVKAKRSVGITPQVSGEIIMKDPAFDSGGYFTTGQELLKIDDTDYLLAVARAEADVAQAEVNLARAEEEAQVARSEWSRIGGRNKSDEPTPLVLHEPQLKLAQAGLEAARAALRQARVNLDRCTISAPFDGRVLEAGIEVGQYLRAGNPVGTIYATDTAEITVPVPDEDLAWIRLDNGDHLAGKVTVTADFAGAEHTWEGQAVRLGGAVDSRSRLVPVVVEVDNPYERSGQRPPLVEGMFVEVRFAGQAPDGALVIPRIALRPGNRVWVADRENRVSVRQVTVARAGVDEALVTDGLSAGERVITSNLQYVTDGMPVTLEGQGPAGSQSKDPAQEKGGEK